ncbi:hypothetical protein GQX74_000869 [Glossina fuscipes]|nr:hypothetical protein GQX74_000869 [Glossina fuscipes]
MNQTNESIQPETHQGPKTEYLTYYCAFTGSELKVPMIPINQKRVEYPNKYFSETRDKPTMEITAYDCGLETLRSLLFDYLHATDIARSPTPDFIPHYMYLVAEKMKYNLTKRWESYGCTIEPGEVTPLSFVNITLNATRISDPNPNNSTSFNEKDDLWLMTQLSGAYRMGQTASTQRNTLEERIKTLARSQVKGIANYREYAYLTQFDTLQKMEKEIFPFREIMANVKKQTIGRQREARNRAVSAYDQDSFLFSSLQAERDQLSKERGTADAIFETYTARNVISKLSTQITDLEQRFNAERDHFPPLCIVTSYEQPHCGNIWSSAEQPNPFVLARVTLLARQCLDYLERSLISPAQFIKPSRLFTPCGAIKDFARLIDQIRREYRET